MGNSAEDLKGRAKQAAGDLTDDGELKREGTLDRAAAKAKDAANDAIDKVKDAVDRD